MLPQKGIVSALFKGVADDSKSFKAALLEHKGFVGVFGLPEPSETVSSMRSNRSYTSGASNGM